MPNMQQRYGSGTSVVGKRYDPVAKGILTQGTKPVLAIRKPVAATAAFAKPPRPAKQIIGKVGLLEMARKAPSIARAGFKAGQSGAKKPRMPLGAATAFHQSKTLQNVARAGKYTAENRGLVGLGTGLVGGSVITGLRNDVEKAHGDPEDARYARLGAGAAVLGAGGAGGLGYAVHDARRTGGLLRGGGSFRANNTKFKRKIHIVEGRGKDKVEREVMMTPPKLKALGARFDKTGLAMTRRGALAGAGGLAALGGAEALRRRAAERRWY